MLIVLAASVLTAALVTPASMALARRLGAVAAPDAHRIHTRPTPTLGGLGILAGFLAGVAAAWLAGSSTEVFAAVTLPLGIVVAAIAVYLVGFIDDIREISAPAKTAGTVLAGSIVNIAGVSILLLRLPGIGLISLAPDVAAVVTVVWVVGMCQAINLIDGLDGLAAGIVAIAAGALFVFADHLGGEGQLASDNPAAIVAVATAGACLGFLPYNAHPARTFMGDGGALLLGLLMAVTSIAVGGNSTEDSASQTFFFFAPLFIPLVILGVPIFDTAFAIARRAVSGAGVTERDTGHLHNRLMRLGHGQWRSVVILWAWTALLSGVVLSITFTNSDAGFLPFVVAAVALSLFTVLHPEARRARRDQTAPDATGAEDSSVDARPPGSSAPSVD